MINAKLVTCELCQNYYADPRQIPCAHSFCFDCIAGHFNEATFSLNCPKCDKCHRYNSLEEFYNRCMPDGFLTTLVTQFKKNQSRLSAVSSRPSSTVSYISATPLPRLLTPDVNSNHPDQQSSSARSTPSQKSTSKTTSLVAKCQACNIRGELIVCQHCDNVICVKCADEHQNVINKDVEHEWERCQTKFESIHEQSVRFDKEEEEAHAKARHLQTFITQQSGYLIQTIEHQKNAYLDMIEKHRPTSKQCFVHEQIVDEYESIDKRLGELLSSADITDEKINDFLFEIEHLEGRLDNLNQLLESNPLKFPRLTRIDKAGPTSFLGTLDFVHLNAESARIEPYSLPMINGHHELPLKFVDEDYIFIDPSTKPSPNLSTNSNVQKKKLLWQVDYFSVPYYVRTCANQLYICDKYGSLAIYKLNTPQKPTLIREVKLFKDAPTSNTNDEDQTIIDSFAVSKLWIIVFKRKKNELHGTIYLFTHEGKLIPNGRCVHNYPSRELTVDTERKILWSLDQKQLCLFYFDLPETKSNNPEECFQTRQSHVQFSKPFAPIHISVNQDVLAVLDKNRQAVHVYEKKSRRKIDEHVNTYCNATHFCWDMALFSDNSLLIKLDETSTLKTGPSKHVYLQLDATREHHIIGMIEEVDAYGMMITSNDEILIGVRINTKGIVKCYV